MVKGERQLFNYIFYERETKVFSEDNLLMVFWEFIDQVFSCRYRWFFREILFSLLKQICICCFKHDSIYPQCVSGCGFLQAWGALPHSAKDIRGKNPTEEQVLKQMLQRILYTLCCCFLAGIPFACRSFAQSAPLPVRTLRIGTMDLPPYGWIDEQGKKQGIIYEMEQEIGLRSGMPFTNEIYPFNRLLRMLKKGKLDLISSQAHQAAEDAGEKLGVQFTINVIAGTRKGSGIREIEDFKNSFLVYHHSATYSQLEGLPRDIQRVKSYRQALHILHTRKIVDGAVFSEPAYYYWMQDFGLTPDDFGNVIMIERGKKQWIFVRKDLPAEIRSKLKGVVEEIYQEKMYERLLNKYTMKGSDSDEE